MKLALLTAGFDGDNAGDSFIEDAVRRIVVADVYERYPLTTALTEEQFVAINDCDAAIICGTNLYQSVFACNLTEEAIEQIRCPIIPMGLGSSARIAQLPKMNRDGCRAVRALHRRCKFSSVRDRASLRFLNSIGVNNVMLTGCPVFFHALNPPDFANVPIGTPVVSLRARLLHVESGHESKQRDTLDELCRRYRPRLVIQSPYDRAIAEELSDKFDLEMIESNTWQAAPYISAIAEQSWTAGFRLHYGMLSLAHGKLAWFVAHDSRVSEFCDLVGLPYFDIRSLDLNSMVAQIDNSIFPGETLRMRWIDLAAKMRSFLKLNGLSDRLEGIKQRDSWRNPQVRAKSGSTSTSYRPKVLFLVDRPDWAFDHSARALVNELGDSWKIDIRYVASTDTGRPTDYDLLYVFFWGETFQQRWEIDPADIIKEVSSHRWEDDPLYGPCTPAEMSKRFLRDADTIACTSRRLQAIIDPHHANVFFAPNGINPKQFCSMQLRTGPMRIGWAGNLADPVKGVRDILTPACGEDFCIEQAPGNVAHSEMNAFYNLLDVFAVASRHEGEPLTLIEAMAAGCFPVCSDVGIVRELVTHQENGWIVSHRTPESFREAFLWCRDNLEFVRDAGQKNALRTAVDRNWTAMAAYYRQMFSSAWERSQQPRFRNDDVSWDTDLSRFSEFCEIFAQRGLKQLHGITLHGRTNTLYEHPNGPAEYPNTVPLSEMSNDEIRIRSKALPFKERKDLISYLGSSGDELALHGLFHTDYSRMTFEEQCREIELGLTELEKLFPQKSVRYFIPPFNRSNADTVNACSKFSLHLMRASGVHLEESLSRLTLYSGVWHRYHHHRFYPESTFSFYKLSIDDLRVALDGALANRIDDEPTLQTPSLATRFWRQLVKPLSWS